MKKLFKLMAISALISPQLFAINMDVCKKCHGKNFEKKALGGKSKVVKDMSKTEIIKALKGYKKGTYGGAMKSTMKNQVTRFSDKDIEEIANKIKK